MTKNRRWHGFNTQPAWSPDGSRIAYANWSDIKEDLAGEIYLVRRNGTGLARLTRRRANFENDPEWSPSGRLIAFSARRGTYVMDRSGGHRRRVARYGIEEAWSPDGKLIAIARENPAGIYVVRSDGTGLRTVAAPHGDGTSGFFDIGLAWSPDGRTLAWSLLGSDASSGSSCEIWLANLDGNAPRQLTSPSTGACDASPSWAPDGSVIAFGRDSTGLKGVPPNPSDGIYLVRPDGTGLEMVPSTEGGDEPAWRP